MRVRRRSVKRPPFVTQTPLSESLSLKAFDGP